MLSQGLASTGDALTYGERISSFVNSHAALQKAVEQKFAVMPHFYKFICQHSTSSDVTVISQEI